MSGGRIVGVDAVDNDEEILTLDVPDEALERAANAERQAFTWCIALTDITGTTATGHSRYGALVLVDPVGYADAGADLRFYCLFLAWRQPAR